MIDGNPHKHPPETPATIIPRPGGRHVLPRPEDDTEADPAPEIWPGEDDADPYP